MQSVRVGNLMSGDLVRIRIEDAASSMIEPTDCNSTASRFRFDAEGVVRAMELIVLSKCLAGS
jgi:hypothetical protein